MNEKTWNFVLDGICAAALLFIGWILFRDIHSDGKRDAEVRDELDAAAADQQQAAAAADRIAAGIDSSRATVEAAAAANGNTQATAASIAGTASAVETAIDSAADRERECAELVAESQRRTADSEEIIRGIRSRT